MKNFKNKYNDYKKEISEKTNIEDLEFERIKLEKKISIVNHPVLYMTIAISIFSIVISLLKDKTYDLKAIKICLILLGAIFVLLIMNEVQSFRNKSAKWKSEVIKLRIEKLKQEELKKNRKLELEEEKKNNKELNDNINKINSFLGIK